MGGEGAVGVIGRRKCGRPSDDGLAETIGDSITNMIVYAVIDIAVYFADTF